MIAVLKQTAELTAQCAVSSGFIPLLERIGDRQARLLRVLTYHRVDDPADKPELYPGLISATPPEFDWQMRYVAENYRAISLQEVLSAWERRDSLPPKSVLITFDDGYRDFAQHAWPVLRRYQLPVTVFIPTAYPDQPAATFWWDRLYAAIQTAQSTRIATSVGQFEWPAPEHKGPVIKKLMAIIKSLPDEDAQALVQDIGRQLESASGENPVLGWEALRTLADEGVTLAPHTRHHPLLNRVDAGRARDEIAGSLADLQAQFKHVPPVLAYPSGAYHQSVVDLLPELGIKLAFTTCRGLNDWNRLDPYRIRRINIGRRTTPALLRTQLLPWAVHLNRWTPVPKSIA